SPWTNEIAAGKNFVGAAGYTLERLLKRAGYDRPNFLVANSLWCFPGDVLVTAQNIQRAYRRSYSGPVVELRTKRGNLTGTPNHPILTRRGWFSLGKLHIGDYLVRSSGADGVSDGDPNIHYPPTTFHELFGALSQSGVRQRVAGTNMDFHGDGMDSNVEIISLNGLLPNRQQSSRLEEVGKYIFELANDCMAGLISNGSSAYSPPYFANAALSSPSGSMNYGQESVTFLPAHPSPAQLGSLGLIPSFDTAPIQGTCQSGGAATEPSHEVLDGLSSSVTFDEVLELRVRESSGHVFNLQTSSGQYSANGYVVSNCKPPTLNWTDQHWRPEVAKALAQCAPYLDDLVAQFKPRVVVPMGNVALRRSCGVSGIESRHSYVHESVWGIPAIPTFHPSYIMQG
ncbi:hypothetical protein LCGC14_2849750, partial [marine sediment metagenome]